ncbi:hypothetical protein ABI_45530 [Asticcacaulis biprosthecium C19]|uniref:DUF433 domain-containing protein n=2 Tax=Asticcacaulis biprosthecium TaxID=76891 RepID=F4QTQ6_9CAUL|nr:hypothetical protein ABI_45530 [Asticcacaulis biprosthecium C19]
MTHESVVGGQGVVFELISVFEDMKNKAEALRKRSAEEVGKITQNRYVAHNARVFAGTRIPVETVRRFYRAGYSVDGILAEYPTLKRADVEVAIAELQAA